MREMNGVARGHAPCCCAHPRMIMMGSSARVPDDTAGLMPLPLVLGALPLDVVTWRACLRSRCARPSTMPPC